MHELSLCQSVLAVAEGARAGREVATVHLQVGQLRQVVPETLVYCWGIVSEGTGLDGAELVVDHVPVTLKCADCGATTTVGRTLILTCSSCQSGRVEVLTGEEFMLTTLELTGHQTDPQAAIEGAL